MSATRGRSPEAKKRRAPKVHRVLSGRRVACDVCKVLHPLPECPPDAEAVTIPLTLPPWLHARLKERVEWGERSAFVRRLVEEALS